MQSARAATWADAFAQAIGSDVAATGVEGPVRWAHLTRGDGQGWLLDGPEGAGWFQGADRPDLADSTLPSDAARLVGAGDLSAVPVAPGVTRFEDAFLFATAGGAWWVPEAGTCPPHAPLRCTSGEAGIAAARTLVATEDGPRVIAHRVSTRFGDEAWDWTAGLRVRTDADEVFRGADIEARWSGALLMPSRSAPVATFPVWGDASVEPTLDVRVADRGPVLTLDVTWTDDRVVAVPADATDAAFVDGDHVEIWLSTRESNRLSDPCQHEDLTLRQLGVALDAAGVAHARWLFGDGPVPVIEALGGGVRVVLPIDRSRWTCDPDGGDSGPFAWNAETNALPAWPMTVAFSDGDASGQRALVATSTLAWGDGRTLGALVLVDGLPAPRMAQLR